MTETKSSTMSTSATKKSETNQFAPKVFQSV